MVVSKRIDFYHDINSLFIPKYNLIQNSSIIKIHPEFKELMALKVKALDSISINPFECTKQSKDFVKTMNNAISNFTKTPQDYSKLMQSIFRKFFTNDAAKDFVKGFC